MRNKFIYTLALCAFAIVSCDETTENIGASLTDSNDHLKIMTDTFIVSSRSIVADSVLARSSNGYLGRIKDPETGATITGNFMAQFHILENYKFPADDEIATKDGNGIYADSCELRLYYNDFYGDSLAVMKMTAYEMSRPMEEGSVYYSNYDPMDNGYIDANGFKVSKTYTLANMKDNAEMRHSSSYVPHISIPLNKEYTDKNGKKYKNYGTYIMQKYKENPSYFKNSYNFIHEVCPGFYFKIDNGIGSMANIYLSQLNVFYKVKKGDKEVVATASFSGTEEVIQKTVISNDRNSIKILAEDNSCTYLRTPAGIFTELTLPVEEIAKGHERDTLNTAKIILRKINTDVGEKHSLVNATRLLLIQKDSLYSFFEKNKLNDNKRTFLSDAKSQTSKTESSYNNTYVFSNISSLVTFINKMKTEGEKRDSNWKASHPNWNRVVIVPVSVKMTAGTTYTPAQIIAIDNEMRLTSTKLVGGSANPYSPIEISVVYSKFSDK
ncbi:MAG: DUF4270 domain-containing protein [Prevotella sp.]|uniref:DUF4270 domain-containing protein n=1 Tax=Prevotella sp. TaxID=59823 RepID=UPI002A2AA1DC|nr:DUF4270 domain-containing protein [Prevotella sp.]MDD7317687.1 DUF4270 domain-containing protein [Prevotellaceae bacterium]MDY4020466.1 DUF4270 domain-containing protein [Prevotella sp.]